MFSIILSQLTTATILTSGIKTAKQPSSTEGNLDSELSGTAEKISNKRKRDIDSSTNVKQCTKCKQILPKTDFNKESKRPDGLCAWCRQCKKLQRPKCEQCEIQAIFGYQHKKPLRCKKHIAIGMTDVSQSKCLGCNTKSRVFGLPSGKALYCGNCRSLEMIDIRNPKCISEKCQTRPSFGYDRPIYCAQHKIQDMVDVTNRACSHNSCLKSAVYADDGHKAEFCSSHASSGMINVVTKRCEVEGCDIIPKYAMPGLGKKRCCKHKQPGMVYARYVRCVHNGCSNASTHGIGYAMSCEVHALSTHKNLVEHECQSCQLVQILNSNRTCQYCDTQLTEPQKIYLKDQKQLQAELDADDDMNDYIFTDQRIKIEQDVTCSTVYRPDFLYDLGTHILIIENDEHQHRANSYQCEQKRIRQIAQDLLRAVFVIRFNCHGYKIDDRSIKTSWIDRIKELKKWVLYAKQQQNITALVTQIYLFYDEFSAQTTQPEIVEAYETSG